MELFEAVSNAERLKAGQKLTAPEAIELMEGLMKRFGIAGMVVYRYVE